MSTHIRTLLVSVLAIALLAWFLSHANLADVWAHVRTADGGLLFLAFFYVVLTYALRVIRWQVLLVPLGRVRIATNVRATIIGFAALSLLPARAGDLLRPYLLATREGLRPPAVFATIVLERVLDLIAVVVLMAVYVWGFAKPGSLPPRLQEPLEYSAAVAGAASIVLLAVTWLLATHPQRVGSLVALSSRFLPHRLADRLAEVATHFSGGFAAARKPGALLASILWSFPLWMVIAAEAWAVTKAFGIEMSFPGSFLLQALLVIGVAVPTPGGVGSFHEMYRFGVTSFFGASNDSAVAAAIIVHAMSYVPVVLVGVLLMIQDGISVGQLQKLAGEARESETHSLP